MGPAGGRAMERGRETESVESVESVGVRQNSNSPHISDYLMLH